MSEGSKSNNQNYASFQREWINLIRTDGFHKGMLFAIGGILSIWVLHAIVLMLTGGNEISSIESTIRFVLFAVLVVELMAHYCLSQIKQEVYPEKRNSNEYNIKVTMEEEEEKDENDNELTEKITTRLENYIHQKKDLDECLNGLLDDFKGYDPDDIDSPDNSVILDKDEYLPWQESITEPANPFSLATAISMKSINHPGLKAHSPIGGPKPKEKAAEEVKDNVREVPRRNQQRLSIRNCNISQARGSLISEMSAYNEPIAIPKFHTDYFENQKKKEEIDSHASWISFVLFEETKKMERLALLEEEEQAEFTHLLRKRSTGLNIATTAQQNVKFTNREKDFNEDKFILFNNKRYDKRRASSVIKKITSPMPKGVIECMLQFKTWNFNAFTLNDVTSNNPLSYFMQYIYQAYSLEDKLDINRNQFKAFFCEIQELYHKENHYHNAIHAADVAQGVFYMLEKGEANVVCGLNLLETISSLVGAAIHDVDHPGVNNYYLVNTKSPLAVVYNDKSVLENCHAACAFNILRDEKYDICSNLTPESIKTFRSIVINTVLATDNAVHFEHLNKFKARKAANNFDPKGTDKLDLLSLVLHSADLSNPTRPLDYSKKWTMRVLDEFFLQGDKERDLGLPISNLCDRYSINVAQSQIGFFDFFVKPFFSEFTEVFPAMSFVIGNVELNVEYWKTQTKRCQKELEDLKKD